MRSDGRTAPSRAERFLDKMRFRLRDSLQKSITVSQSGREFKFFCASDLEVRRATTLFTKEAGTCAWLASQLKPTDVFYDIGANVGIYSIYASKFVTPPGRVYAFEPHARNFLRLIENIQLNEVADRVRPISFALDVEEGLGNFEYGSLEAGTSLSQYDSTQRNPTGVFSELKFATSVDRLIEQGVLPPPQVVKIDVDGIEAQILQGMTKLLAGEQRPRTLLVEIQKGDEAGIVDWLAGAGYALVERQLTSIGKKKQQKRGFSIDEIAHNAIFELLNGSG